MKKIEPYTLCVDIQKADLLVVYQAAHKEYTERRIAPGMESLFLAQCYFTGTIALLQSKGYKLIKEEGETK